MVAIWRCLNSLVFFVGGVRSFRVRHGHGRQGDVKPLESEKPLEQALRQLAKSLPSLPEVAAEQQRSPKEHPLIVAHRGDSIAFPENTLEAFRSAHEKGAHVLECDLYLSADGVVMVHHDDTVTRTTEAEGSVDSYTYEELSRLDAGYRFTLDGGNTYPFRGQGVRIPSLREALLALPEAIFNIDLKQGEALVRPVAALIDELGCQDRVQAATTKFDGSFMDTFRQLQPRVKTVATIGETVGFMALAAVGLSQWHKPVGFEYQVPVIRWLSDSERVIRAANSLGQTLQHWTVNDGAEMARLLEAGSDGIITDDISLAVEVFARYRPPQRA